MFEIKFGYDYWNPEIEQLAPKYFHDSMRLTADIFKTSQPPKFKDSRSYNILLYNIKESCVEHPFKSVWMTVEDILYDLIEKNWSGPFIAKWLKTLIPNYSKSLTLYKKDVKVAP